MFLPCFYLLLFLFPEILNSFIINRKDSSRFFPDNNDNRLKLAPVTTATATAAAAVAGSTTVFEPAVWFKPQHIPIPRQRMNISFAVMLMRSSYNMLDDMDVYPMDVFQREFFLFRQSEWEDYRSFFLPTGIIQGDLADPFYFDFISFAQYATIANALRHPKQEFTEKVGANGELVQVKRKEGFSDDATLPVQHSALVGDYLLEFIQTQAPLRILSLPKNRNLESSRLVDSFLANSKAALDYMTNANYCLSYSLEVNELAEKQWLVKIEMKAPVTLWSSQALMNRKDRPLNDFETKILRSLSKASGFSQFERINSDVTSNINLVHHFKLQI